MNEGIVIATSPGRECWAFNCAKTLQRPYVIVSTWGYELGKIKWAYDNTNWDRFVFLQDSVEITDNSIFDRIWDTPGSICLHHEARHMSCYLGVYERKILDKIDIPIVTDKISAVTYEQHWVEPYLNAVEEITCFDTDGKFGGVVWKLDRENLVYTNSFLVKYRGDWSQRPIEGNDPEDRKLK